MLTAAAVSVISNVILLGSARWACMTARMSPSTLKSPIVVADKFAWTTRPDAASAAAHAITRRSIFGIRPCRSAAGTKAAGTEHLAVLGDHSDQELLGYLVAGGEADDRLGVDLQATIRERQAHALDNGQVARRALACPTPRG